MNRLERKKSRRRFLEYLAMSPVLSLAAKSALAQELKGVQAADPMTWWPHDPTYVVEKPEDALDVFELEAVAHKNVAPAHFGFVASGADGEGSLRANRHDFNKFALRSRRLRDVRSVDTSITLFGQKHSTPFFLCPVGYESAHHKDGVGGALRASGRHNVAQMISTYASLSTGDARKEHAGIPVMFQLYFQPEWEVNKLLVERADRDGCPAIAVTVDLTSARKDTQWERSKRADSRLCVTCHTVPDPKSPKNVIISTAKPATFSDIPEDLYKKNSAVSFTRAELTWESIKRLRDVTKKDIFLKGIMHPEDAALCVKYGFGVYVSNHGGRDEDTSASTIGALPDIVSTVKGKVPIFIDGGFRRGMDFVKAIAMGATMAGFGRPWVWGLGAFGEAGVDRAIQILKAELAAAMQQVGAASLKDLDRSIVFPTEPWPGAK